MRKESVWLALLFMARAAIAVAEPTASQPATIMPRECLVIRRLDHSRRAAIHTDEIEAQIVAGTWTPPKEGDEVRAANGKTAKWEKLEANKDGVFENRTLQNGYAYVSIDLPPGPVAPPVDTFILNATGHTLVYVNGEPRTGDPYSSGIAQLPVHLRPGRNDFLFLCGRGSLRMRLDPPRTPYVRLEDRTPTFLSEIDATVPDLVVGQPIDAWIGVILINPNATAMSRELGGGAFVAAVGRSEEPVDKSTSTGGWTVLGGFDITSDTVLSFGTRKRPIRLKGPPPQRTGSMEVRLAFYQFAGGRMPSADELASGFATANLKLNIVQADQLQKRTFLSDIDGSVQYYALRPMQPRVEQAASSMPSVASSLRGSVASSPALFLSLHGANVEATSQAAAYAAKSWGHLVAPTNRRKYGFDWEDWGRLDAIEVLDIAQRELHTDPHCVYLTGHSMGGHGTWTIGATFPDRFAAIGPSAGWISFWSYAGATKLEGESAIAEILRRATASSDTLALSRNYLHHGVYILHGDKDDNVPVEQARDMFKHMSGFHHDVIKHEQPGAGHWWGDACVDWPPMFDLFARHRLADNSEVRRLEFVTVNPGVSARCHWVTIEDQQRAMLPSSVDLECNPVARRFSGTTKNVARLSLALDPLVGPPPASVGGSESRERAAVHIELDGQKLDDVIPDATVDRIWLARRDDKWSVIDKPNPRLKGPHRSGPFKNAFQHRFMFVYGTHGTLEENAWAFAKARFDAETFWYRGNGSADVIPDSTFSADAEPDRSVILYGNADSNSAWKPLLGNSPVQMARGRIRVDQRELTGDDLASLFIQPRPGSDVAMVAVIGGTGLPGMRLTDRLPYFQSGVAYPDCIVLGTDVLTRGLDGVRAAGYFGSDWSVKTGEFAWAGAPAASQ